MYENCSYLALPQPLFYKLECPCVSDGFFRFSAGPSLSLLRKQSKVFLPSRCVLFKVKDPQVFDML